MAETALQKILRLTNGVTRQYQRTEPTGRVQVVRQYSNNRPVHPVPVGSRPAAARPQQGRQGTVAFGSLKVGQVVRVQARRYQVLRVHVPPLTTGSSLATGSQGAGVNTSGPASTGSRGAGVNTSAPNPQTLLLGSSVIKSGTAQSTSEWKDVSSGAVWFVTLPLGFPVQVVG